MAYTAEDAADGTRRPLMFSFNGGPGSASLWLHLGALGPQRVALPDDASFPEPPFKLVDNPDTWLAETDLVFIDPVGTGYSRAAKPDQARKFFSLRGDIESIREFIRLYLTREERWGSPLYLVGESYGTTRAAGLSEDLLDHGIAPSGILLVSTVLNFQTVRFANGNDLPYILYLPSYAATAWYHRKLEPELQADLHRTYEEVHAFALGEYTLALAQGDRLSPEKRQDIAAKIARYTGLSAAFVDRSDLRIELGRFCKELLRDRKRTVGRLDSRYVGIDADAASSNVETDPSMSAIRAPYTSAFHQLIRGRLGYRTDLPYYVLGEGIGAWDYGGGGGSGPGGGQGYADTSASLRDAMAKNPHLRLFVASGYYDLATPIAATEYTLEHMDLDPSMRPRITTRNYDSGHMMYIHEPSMRQLAQDVFTFLKADAAR
jgi:carboxypeptidase C (cathepsin A)